ncbi:MAG: hypothetical protein HZB71_09245 [Betaproteobacteria bacterium]|nr:hypothetical protein [Betaproteobacteria bacterium]
MKSPLTILALVAALSLSAGAAQADARTCPLDAPAPTARQTIPAEMARIEAALRSGQLTPYEAGRQMRQQWEMAQFQRGFLEPAAAAAPRAGGCNSGLGVDLAPLGEMAKSGMQTASTLMRALMKETERLVQEKPAL